MPVGEAPAPDVDLALQAAATRLRNEFRGVDTDTVEQLLHSRYDRFATDATVFTFLPLLAARATRQELKTIAASSAGNMVGVA